MIFKECADQWYKRAMCGTTYSYQVEVACTVKHLNAFLGNIEMKNLTWINVEDVLLSYARYNPKTKQPSSQHLIIDLRNAAYNICEYAIDIGEIENNPVRRRKLPRTKPVQQRRALTEKERGYVFSTPHRMRVPALIMLFCGLRPNEVIPLEFTDFEIANDNKTMILRINKSVSKVAVNEYVVKPGTKNGKNRVVTVPSALADVIVEENEKTESNLITTQNDGKMHSPSSWKSAWKSYQNALNYAAYRKEHNGTEGYYSPNKIPRKTEKITPYMFRHTYATMLYTSEVDILTASKLMGHSEIKTTLKVYTHLEESTIIKNISKFENYVNENYSKLISF